jgi:asparagine synthase (glutamine-hydrolysing)
LRFDSLQRPAIFLPGDPNAFSICHGSGHPMSGIAGIARRFPTGVADESLGRMAAAIQHRGPDGYGFYITRSVGFAHVRLSVVDITAGAQPMTNEDGSVVVTYNGEIYNYRELRTELEGRGHNFQTRCDTEVLVHGYEEWSTDLLHRLNGQFAFAIHDRSNGTVFVARDRFGARPLFYAQRSGDFFFASEIKALFASGEVDPALDARGLDEVLTFGAARNARTPFSGVASLEPGTYGIWKDGALWLRHYYELDYPEAADEPPDAVEQLDEIMLRSVGMRLRAELPVGAHVSGGLSSWITASLAASASPRTLRSFSIDVGGPLSSARVRQREVGEAVGSLHASCSIGADDIAESFPNVLWHAETPMLSTDPVAMYHLAKLTRDSGTRVVVRGDGANELFLGSDVFKEASVRRFCLRRPESLVRQRLFDRVYPQLGEQGLRREFWSRTFLEGDPRDPLFSHLPRFRGPRMGMFYSPEFANSIAGVDVIGELRASLPTRFFAWSPLNQAAYLEMTTRLSPHVLSSCGDRMLMAHGVEGRYPFLDHRLFEFAAALPTRSRLIGLRDKEILRRWASRILPRGVGSESASIIPGSGPADFFGRHAPRWIGEHLSPEAVRRVGIFATSAVETLVRRYKAGSVTELPWNQPLVGVLSTQLWHHQFVQSALTLAPLPLEKATVVLRDNAASYHNQLVANRANTIS